MPAPDYKMYHTCLDIVHAEFTTDSHTIGSLSEISSCWDWDSLSILSALAHSQWHATDSFRSNGLAKACVRAQIREGGAPMTGEESYQFNLPFHQESINWSNKINYVQTSA